MSRYMQRLKAIIGEKHLPEAPSKPSKPPFEGFEGSQSGCFSPRIEDLAGRLPMSHVCEVCGGPAVLGVGFFPVKGVAGRWYCGKCFPAKGRA